MNPTIDLFPFAIATLFSIGGALGVDWYARRDLGFKATRLVRFLTVCTVIVLIGLALPDVIQSNDFPMGRAYWSVSALKAAIYASNTAVCTIMFAWQCKSITIARRLRSILWIS